VGFDIDVKLDNASFLFQYQSEVTVFQYCPTFHLIKLLTFSSKVEFIYFIIVVVEDIQPIYV